jgi:hypothetical protein
LDLTRRLEDAEKRYEDAEASGRLNREALEAAIAAQRDDAAVRTESLRAEVQNAIARATAQSGALAKAEADLSDVRSARDAANAELTVVRAVVAQQEVQIRRLEEELDRVRLHELTDAQQTALSLRREVEEMRHSTDDCIVAARAQTSEAETRCAVAERAVAAAEAKAAALIESEAAVRHELVSLRQEAEVRHEAVVRAGSAALDAAREEARTLRARIATLAAENARLSQIPSDVAELAGAGDHSTQTEDGDVTGRSCVAVQACASTACSEVQCELLSEGDLRDVRGLLANAATSHAQELSLITADFRSAVADREKLEARLAAADAKLTTATTLLESQSEELARKLSDKDAVFAAELESVRHASYAKLEESKAETRAALAKADSCAADLVPLQARLVVVASELERLKARRPVLVDALVGPNTSDLPPSLSETRDLSQSQCQSVLLGRGREAVSPRDVTPPLSSDTGAGRQFDEGASTVQLAIGFSAFDSLPTSPTDTKALPGGDHLLSRPPPQFASHGALSSSVPPLHSTQPVTAVPRRAGARFLSVAAAEPSSHPDIPSFSISLPPVAPTTVLTREAGPRFPSPSDDPHGARCTTAAATTAAACPQITSLPSEAQALLRMQQSELESVRQQLSEALEALGQQPATPIPRLTSSQLIASPVTPALRFQRQMSRSEVLSDLEDLDLATASHRVPPPATQQTSGRHKPSTPSLRGKPPTRTRKAPGAQRHISGSATGTTPRTISPRKFHT